MLFQPPRSSSGGSSDGAALAALDARVDALEEKHVVAVWFETVGSGTGGALAPPTGGVILLDRFPERADVLVSTCDSDGHPAWESPRTAGGDLVTAELDAAGNWSLHGVPAQYPLALVYCYRSTVANRDQNFELVGLDLDLDGGGTAGPIAVADVTGLPEALADKADAADAADVADDLATLALVVAEREPAITPKRSAFNADFGTIAGTVCEGNDGRLSDPRQPLPHDHAMSDVTGLVASLADRARVLFALATPVPCVQGISTEQVLATFPLGAGRIQAGEILLLFTAWSITQNASYSKYAYVRANGALWQSTSMLNTKAVETLNPLFVQSLTSQQGWVNPVTPFGSSAVDWSSTAYAADLTGDQTITLSCKLHPSAMTEAMTLIGAWAQLIRGAS